MVDSPRRRAKKSQDKGVLGKSDETKSKEMVEQDLKDRENLPQMDESEKLMEAGLDQLQIIDSFDPAYEFEVIGEEDWAT